MLEEGGEEERRRGPVVVMNGADNAPEGPAIGDSALLGEPAVT